MANNNLEWSERAQEEYKKLFWYLLNEWGEAIALKVRSEIDATVIRIRDYPEQFPIFLKNRKIRRCVLSRQTSIFFKVSNDFVEVVAIFDNRQNQKKLRKLQ